MDQPAATYSSSSASMAIELRVPASVTITNPTPWLYPAEGASARHRRSCRELPVVPVGGVIAHHAAFADDLVEFHPPMFSLGSGLKAETDR